MIAIGGTPVDIDYGPFRDAGELLYAGPWLAERYASIQSFMEQQPGAIEPVVYEIIAGAKSYSATDTFNAFYRLAELIRDADAQWHKMDLMLVPTAGTTYRISDIANSTIKLNSNLGYYTTREHHKSCCGAARKCSCVISLSYAVVRRIAARSKHVWDYHSPIMTTRNCGERCATDLGLYAHYVRRIVSRPMGAMLWRL
jgi:hypothetical protein